MTVSKSSGKFKLIENGEKAVDKYNKEIVDYIDIETYSIF